MTWTNKQIQYIIAEMIDENPLACKALFRITDIVFSKKVPTMAISLSSKPVLLINMTFCNEHLKYEKDVKTVLMHEFLHVILMHTEKYKINTPLLNIALDAIVNSIIHRTFGDEYSDFFCRFYNWELYSFLLRPRKNELNLNSDLQAIHEKIYAGKICADDLHEFLEYLLSIGKIKGKQKIVFLGNHDFASGNVSDENKAILDEIMNKMDGTLIWKNSGVRGLDFQMKNDEVEMAKFRLNNWRKETYKILKRCLIPDKKSRNSESLVYRQLPIMCATDRAAMSKSSWTGILPFANHGFNQKANNKSVHVYLDVSGSMDDVLNQISQLLFLFRKEIRKPLWVFSNDISEAKFRDGKIIYQTTSGTSISCVFDHMRKMKIKKAMIVTDGFIENITDDMLRNINTKNIMILLSAEGSATQFFQRGIKYHQLKSL